jgi:hypothetical protein
MATFTDVYKQELKSKGILSSIGTAALNRAREKLDIRNMLFGGSGAIAATGQKVFGKGYQAIQRGGSTTKAMSENLSTGTQSIALDQLLISSQKQETQLAIIAKNTMNSNAMARDMNVMRQNIMKLVTMGGGKASRGADMFFKEAAAREASYESQFKKDGAKKETTPTPVAEKSKSGGMLAMFGGIATAIVGTIRGALGGIPELLKNIFSVDNLLKMFGIAGNVISGFAKLLPMLISPAFLGIIAAIAGATWLMKWLNSKNDEANTPEKIQGRIEDNSGSTARKVASESASTRLDQGLRDLAAGNYSDETVQRYTGGKQLPSGEIVGGIKTQKELQDAIKLADSQGKKRITIDGPSAAEQAKNIRLGSSPTKMTLLDAIAKGESAGAGGYDAMNQGTVGLAGRVVGSGNSEKVIGKKLTDMTIGEIMTKGAKKTDSAEKRRDQGLIFAAGRYQIIPETLKGLVDSGIASRDEKFSPEVQDRLGMQLIKQTGATKLAAEGKYDEAQNALAKTWAGIPLATDVVDKKGNLKKAGQSFYAGPGNKAHAGSGKDVRASLMAMNNNAGDNLTQGSSALAAMTRDMNVAQAPNVVVNAPQTNVASGKAPSAPVASATNVDALELFFKYAM